MHGQATSPKAVSAVRTHFVASSDPSPHLQESSNCTGAEKLFFALDFFFLRLSAIRKSRNSSTAASNHHPASVIGHPESTPSPCLSLFLRKPAPGTFV